MKRIEKELIQVIADYSGFVPYSIEVLCHFRIAENQLRFDVVYLVFVPATNVYYVIWRWTVSPHFNCRSFNNIDSALEYYINRRNFSVSSNSIRF